jgi:hypothetical protein
LRVLRPSEFAPRLTAGQASVLGAHLGRAARQHQPARTVAGGTGRARLDGIAGPDNLR